MEHGIAYDPRCAVGEDFFFYVKLLAAGARWLQLPNAYYVYYVRASSATRRTSAIDWLTQQAEVAAALQSDRLVAGDPNAVAALEDHRRRCEGRVALRTLAALVSERRFGELKRLVVARPAYVSLAVSRAAHAAYARWRGKVGVLRARLPGHRIGEAPIEHAATGSGRTQSPPNR